MDSVTKTLNTWDERAKVALTPKTKLSLPVKDKRLEDLLLWRNPTQSAAVLCGITLGFWVLNVVAYNPVVVLATVAQFGVLACFLVNVACSALKRPGVPVPAFVSEGISEAEAKDIATRYTVYINKVLALIERIISGKDVVLTLQVAGALFVVAKVAAVVSPLTLTWLGVVSLFTLPKLYELKKEEIDAQVGKAKQQYNNVYEKHIDKIWKQIPKASTATSPSATPLKTPGVAEQAESLAKDVRGAAEQAGGKKLF